MSEVAVKLIWILGVVVLMGGLVAVLLVGVRPVREVSAAIRRSRRLVLARATVSLLAALAVLASAIVLDGHFSQWQGLTVIVGPVAGAAVGLICFALWPSTAIDGQVPRRVASLERRQLAEQVPRWLWRAFLTVGGGSAAITLGLAALSKRGSDGRSLCFAPFSDCPPSYGAYLYPGWFVAVPALIGVGLVVAAAIFCLSRIASTAAPAWQDLSVPDSRLRTNSARLVVLLGITACSLTTGMILLVAGASVSQAPTLAKELSEEQISLFSAAGSVAVLLGLAVLLAGLVAGIAGVVTALGVARIKRNERVDTRMISA